LYRVLLILLLLFPSPDPAPLRLVVMGDSITVGLGASTPDRAWAAIVAQQTGRQLINVAIGGSRVAEQPIPELGPGDLVIWLVGYNDMRAGTPLTAYRATVAYGVQTMRASGARVVVASGLRMTSAGYAAYGPLWNKGSEAAARDYTVTGIDLGGVAPTPVADLVHPNDDQHAAIAQTILAGVLLFAEWVNDRLIVQSGPGCLYLIGNGRPSQWIGCDLPEYVLLPYGDAQYVPMGRTLMLVGDGVTRLDVPARVVVRLVWVVGN